MFITFNRKFDFTNQGCNKKQEENTIPLEVRLNRYSCQSNSLDLRGGEIQYECLQFINREGKTTHQRSFPVERHGYLLHHELRVTVMFCGIAHQLCLKEKGLIESL